MLTGAEVTRCFLATLSNGNTTVRMTSHDADLVVSAQTYSKTPGFNLSRYSVKNGGDPATIDIVIPFSDDGPVYSEHVRKGAWRGATITVWIADFAAPSHREILATGFVGLTQFSERLEGTMELVTRADALKDIILPIIQPKCDFLFCGTRCGVNAATYTKVGEVTGVTNRQKFNATITSPGLLNFTKGRVTWTSGNNSGFNQWVRFWDSGISLIELVTDMPFDIQVGDDFNILSGCEQDRAACIFYDNVDRFPGFEDVVA